MIGIYKITNKINGKVYIGQSIDIERRWKEHIQRDRTNTSLIHLAIIKYGKDNFDFDIIEECSQSELNEKEQYWIKYYNSFENGYNLTRGGEARFYYDIEAIYEDYLRTQNISQTAKNIGCHVNTVRRIIRVHGINHSEMQLDKPVEQIDCKTLKVIHTFNTIKDAADAMNITRDAISMAASGQHKSSAGYYWRFVGDTNKIFKIDQPKEWKKKVQKIDITTHEVLAEFDSTAEAARSLGKDGKNGGSCIGAVCRGAQKSAYGFFWQYY